MNGIDFTWDLGMPTIWFHEGNEYRFAMDMQFFRNIPSDVPFRPISELHNGLIEFAGPGYGGHTCGANGPYGNGSIYAYSRDLPTDVIEWSRRNLLNKPINIEL